MSTAINKACVFVKSYTWDVAMTHKKATAATTLLFAAAAAAYYTGNLNRAGLSKLTRPVTPYLNSALDFAKANKGTTAGVAAATVAVAVLLTYRCCRGTTEAQRTKLQQDVTKAQNARDKLINPMSHLTTDDLRTTVERAKADCNRALHALNTARAADADADVSAEKAALKAAQDKVANAEATLAKRQAYESAQKALTDAAKALREFDAAHPPAK